MQLIVDIKNDSISDKIVWLLKSFQDKGVEVKEIETLESENKTNLSDEYIEKNWREIGMSTHSASLDDDERLYDAAWEFYIEKHSN